MPISNYDSSFGGKPGSAEKAKESMAKTYGSKKGTKVFFATKNKRKPAGVSSKKGKSLLGGGY